MSGQQVNNVLCLYKKWFDGDDFMDFHNMVFWHNVVTVVNSLRKGDKDWYVLAREVDCSRSALIRCMLKLEKDGFVTKKVSSKDKRKFVFSLNDTAFRAFCVERDLYSYVGETIEELGDMRADFVEFLKHENRIIS